MSWFSCLFWVVDAGIPSGWDGWKGFWPRELTVTATASRSFSADRPRRGCASAHRNGMQERWIFIDVRQIHRFTAAWGPRYAGPLFVTDLDMAPRSTTAWPAQSAVWERLGANPHVAVARRTGLALARLFSFGKRLVCPCRYVGKLKGSVDVARAGIFQGVEPGAMPH